MLLRRLLGLTAAGLALACFAGPTSHAAEPQPKVAVPGDADFVLHVDYQKLIASPLFKKHGLEPFKELLKDPQVSQALQATGVDPLKDVDRLAITNSGKFDETGNLFVLVKGRFDADKIAATAKKEGWKTHTEGSLTVYETKGEKDVPPAFVAVLDKNTLVLSNKKDYLVNAVTGKIKPGKNAADLKAALDKANNRDTIYGALILTDQLKEALKLNPQAANLAPKLKSVTVSINVTDAAQIDLLVNTTDANTAGQVSMQIKGSLMFVKALLQGQDNVPPSVGDLIDQVKTGTNGASVTIGLKVTDDLIDKLLKGK